uniref:Outer membrane protein assembly factor BamA n=1 Tax=Magnetococcus massalia (strain MO-1) TaxID=451514 RepID=A0A1S7LHA1_MAGMO|nr:Surface antigen (D15). Outer membrane assembly protein, OMP85 type [Candidatus Magnetococcus massalia]
MMFDLLFRKTLHITAPALLVGILLLPGLSQAQFLSSPSGSSNTIGEIRVEGAKWINKNTVLHSLELEVGDRFSTSKQQKSLKALYKTGFFKDVQLDRQGDVLVVRVLENPLVNEIRFSGNDAMEDDELKQLIKQKKREPYNKARTEADLAVMRQAYRIKGLFLANIELEVEELSQNRVRLTYEIEEGEKSRVQEVRFIGNKLVDDGTLLKKLVIQPTGWLSWLKEDDTYDREKLMFDQQQLRNVYQDQGYARIQVNSSIAELTPDKKAFIVTHSVTEGDRYKFGKLTIQGDFDELPESDLYAQLQMEEGEWFNVTAVRDTREKLTDLIGDFGYAFLDINPKTVYDDEAKTVSLDFQVKKGRRVYLDRIDVVGNNRTRDEVIRREVLLGEGDRFAASKVRKTKNRLRRLDYFEEVEVTTPKTMDPDMVRLKVKVQEKPTGSFTIGAGFSSTDKIISSASVTQRNFLGRGQKLSFSTALSATRTEFEVSFTEPYFLHKPISAGFDLYNRKTDDDDNSSYKKSSYGLGLRLGAALSDHLYNSVSYHIRHVELYDIDSGASSVIQAEYANSPYLQSMVSNTLSWRDMNRSKDGKSVVKGRSHSLTTDFSGLGGDVRFVRLVQDNHFYHPLMKKDKLTGHLRLKGGMIETWDGSVPIYERFNLGGPRTVRGFRSSGIGARSTTDGDSMGGNYFGQVNMELIFPVLGLEDKGVKGMTFIDAGLLNNFDSLGAGIDESDNPRVAAGVGVHWDSPFGPLQFSLGFPLVKEEWDETRTFDFSVGTSL